MNILIKSLSYFLLSFQACQLVDEYLKYEMLKDQSSDAKVCLQLKYSYTFFISRSVIECCSINFGLKVYNAINFYHENKTCVMLNITVEYNVIQRMSQPKNGCRSYMVNTFALSSTHE